MFYKLIRACNVNFFRGFLKAFLADFLSEAINYKKENICERIDWNTNTLIIIIGHVSRNLKKPRFIAS